MQVMQVTLVSSDLKRMELTRTAALASGLLREMLEDENVVDNVEIPLPNVRGDVLKKVVDFLAYHERTPVLDFEKPLQSSSMEQILGSWDATFMNVDHDMLLAIIFAANYMDIKSLLDVSAAKLACTIRGKNKEQINQIFDVKEG